jgi:hypothetical protein
MAEGPDRCSGMFAALSIITNVDGQTTTVLLATVHPSGARMERIDTTATS